MQVLGWILLIILIAILLIPFTTLSIRFQYRKRGADDHVGVTLRWLGDWFAYTIAFPSFPGRSEGMFPRARWCRRGREKP